MLFSRSAALWRKSFPTIARRAKSNSADATDETASTGGSLVIAVGTTFGTYMIADFLSNFIQHPTLQVKSCLYFEELRYLSP
jgi:hypothetical protein